MRLPLEDKDTQFIFCDCEDEGLYIEVGYDNLDDIEPAFAGFDLSFWKRGVNPRKMSLWTRLVVALRVLFTGKIHTDQIMLGASSAEKVGTFLLNHSKKIQELIKEKYGK